MSDAARPRPKKGKPAPSRGSRPGELRGNAGKGRKPGSPNKITKAIKDAAIGALNAGEGAEAFFLERKAEDPNAFMAFLRSIVPHEVALGGPNGEALFGPDQIIKAAAEIIAARARQ